MSPEYEAAAEVCSSLRQVQRELRSLLPRRERGAAQMRAALLAGLYAQPDAGVPDPANVATSAVTYAEALLEALYGESLEPKE